MKPFSKPLAVIAFLFSGFCFGWLCVIAGVWLNQFDRTPLIERGINSAYAIAYDVYNQLLKPDTYAAKNYFWLPERYTKKGAFVHQPESFYGDFTLLLSAHQQGAVLLDKQGKISHEWFFDYSDFVPEHIRTSSADKSRFMYWWQAKVFPNGDILAIVNFDNTTPAGVGLIKVDKNSNLLWHYQGHVHHDFSVNDKGDIYVLEQSVQKQDREGLKFLPKPYIDEWVTVLDSEGNPKRKINLYAALASSPYKNVLRRIKKNMTGDYLHPNAISFVSREVAQTAEYLKADSLVIDIRELDAVMALDQTTETVYWMVRGPWYYQHDSDILENGNLLLFDNLSLGKRSRVIEFDPRLHQVVWQYKGSEELPLYSMIRGAQQALGNGNVLIVESNGSRLLEVNREGQLVWEYYSPVRAQDEGNEQAYAPVFMNAYRYKREQLKFLIQE